MKHIYLYIIYVKDGLEKKNNTPKPRLITYKLLVDFKALKFCIVTFKNNSIFTCTAHNRK